MACRGNLHDKGSKEWIAATEENKLATCGDFIAKISKELSLEKSATLSVCISTFYKDCKACQEQDVSSVAVMCSLQLGYVK